MRMRLVDEGERSENEADQREGRRGNEVTGGTSQANQLLNINVIHEYLWKITVDKDRVVNMRIS